MARPRIPTLLPALLLLGVSTSTLADPAYAQSPCADPLALESHAAATLALNDSEQEGVRQFYQPRGQNPGHATNPISATTADTAANTDATNAANAGCAWSDDQVTALRTVLSRSADQGLDPDRYHPAALAGPASPDRDVSATAIALRYAHDLVMGEVDEAKLSDDIDVPRPAVDLPSELRDALSGNRVGPWLAGLQPADPQYAELVKALAAYRQVAGSGGLLPRLADSFRLRLGQSDQRVVALKARLRASGDLQGDDDSPNFDRATRAALIVFQRGQGLRPDGRLSRDTVRTLNIAPQERVRTIVANLERRRYFGHVLAPTRIEVNTAGAIATLYRDWRWALSMRAVVGDPKHPSPMLISPKLEDIVLDPPWIVPSSIIHRELLPKETRDPGYFAAHDMHWSGKELIQAPGPKNALGRILFNFTNRYSVYLHDTPARSLFARYDRADSHGCVRLEDPIGLALAVLPRDSAWPRDRIEKTISRNKTVHIPVADGPQIVLAYWTAFVDGDGKVEFRDDIYGRDSRLLAAMPFPSVDEPIAALP